MQDPNYDLRINQFALISQSGYPLNVTEILVLNKNTYTNNEEAAIE